MGDLCPHQDFIYFAELRDAEKIAARERERILFGVKYHQIKSFSLSDMDALLNGLFFKERGLFGCAESEISKLKKSAERAGLICKGKFSLLAGGKIKRMCALSLGKLDAIEAIVSAQSAAFGENLRMLILADYIRAEALNSQITRFGVVPVFEMLRKRGFEGLKLGVLSARMCRACCRISNAKRRSFHKSLGF